MQCIRQNKKFLFFISLQHYLKRMAEKCISTIKESSVILYPNKKESIASDETTPRCDQNCDSSCSGTPSTTIPTVMHIPLDVQSNTKLNDTISPDISYAQNTPSTMIHYMSGDCETKNGQTNCEKVDVYLETPVVDDNNESFGASTTTTTVTAATNATNKHSINIVPKRLSDEFYSADDCYSDNEDVRGSVTLMEFNDSSVQVDDKSITPNSNVESSAEMSRFEENSIDNIIDSTYNEDEISSCSNLIDISNEHDDSSPHSTASPGIQDNGEEANHGDDVVYYNNEVQSVDAVDRKMFEIKEKLADAMILRNGSLMSGDNRLNLGLLNTQKIDQDCSPDELSQTIDQNSISTTPTSSRTNTMRFGNAKTTAKLNLSESLEQLDVADSSDKQASSESDYLNKTRNNAGNNHSTVTERSAGDQSPIRIKLLQQHSQMDSFLNSNSNDSLLSFQFSEKKCGNNSESSQSTTATQTSSTTTTNDCDERSTSNHLAIASTSKAAQTSDSSDCTISHSNEIDEEATKGCSVDNCMIIDDDNEIKQEIIEEEVVIADSDSKQPFDIHLPSSSSSQRMSLVNNQQIDENNYDQSHALMGLENDHDYEEDTWADCEEMSDVEEVCTCRDYSDEDVHGNSEDELPSRDVDLSYYAHLDTLSEDILPENANVDSTPKNQRKRKLTEPLSHDDATPGNRKRLALDSVTSPKVLLTPTTPTLIATSPSTHGSVLSDKRTPRLLIPTRDHPPPELSDWLLQFQRWSNAERLLAVDQLIEHCEPTQVRHMMKVIEPHFQRDFISLLPKELALHVLSYLEPKVLLRAAQTCRSWR